MVQCITCHLDSIGSQIGHHSLRPVVLSVQEHGPCHLLQFLDPSFGNPILVMGIDTGKAEALIAGLAAILPSIGSKDSIVSI